MIAKCYQCSDVTIRSLYAHALQLYSNSNNLPPPKVLAIALKYQLPGLAVLNLSTTFHSIIIKNNIPFFENQVSMVHKITANIHHHTLAMHHSAILAALIHLWLLGFITYNDLG